MRVLARATVTIEFNVQGDNWNESSSVEQVHREAAELAIAHVNRLCQRYVKIVGKPAIEAIITRETI
jgi:hypothetical protein